MPPVQRSDSTSTFTTINSPIVIAGVAIICVISFGVISWLGFRFYQKRVAAKRENMGAAFFSVKGVVPDAEKGAHQLVYIRL
jgi:hypothetical protein